jgi:hypothetical protein
MCPAGAAKGGALALALAAGAVCEAAEQWQWGACLMSSV